MERLSSITEIPKRQKAYYALTFEPYHYMNGIRISIFHHKGEYESDGIIAGFFPDRFIYIKFAMPDYDELDFKKENGFNTIQNLEKIVSVGVDTFPEYLEGLYMTIEEFRTYSQLSLKEDVVKFIHTLIDIDQELHKNVPEEIIANLKGQLEEQLTRALN